LTANNCTFLDNDYGPNGKGRAIYGSGLVKLFNNIIWDTDGNRSDLIYITADGTIRNADSSFPSPLDLAKNIVRGGFASFTIEDGATVSLGDTSVTILSDDPLFVDATNPVGPDGVWGTADDGFRLQAGSPAIDQGLARYLPQDASDLDGDGDIEELIMVDLAGYIRQQGAGLDLGPYETGGSALPITIQVQPASQALLAGTRTMLQVTATGYDLGYQWHEGQSGDTSNPVLDENGSTFQTPLLNESATYWVQVSNALSDISSLSAVLTITADELAGAVNNAALSPFINGGDTPWFSQSEMSHDGSAAARSGAIDHSQESFFETTVEGPGTLTFWWQVSSRSGDYLRFYLDGELQTSRSGTSGDWTQQSYEITTQGDHTVKWAYEKNSYSVSGEDCGWVDEIAWSPKLIVNQPVGGDVLEGGTLEMEVLAAGYDLTYQWYEGALGDAANPIPGATAPSFTPSAPAADTSFWVRVASDQGAEQSAEATVVVHPHDSALATILDANVGFICATYGDAPWIAELGDSVEGGSSAASGVLDHEQESVIEGAVEGDGTLSFWWKVSSEASYDFVRFYIDGVELAASSGEGEWQELSFPVSGSGRHTAKWVYTKDVSKASGADQALLDKVTWTPDGVPGPNYENWATAHGLTGADMEMTASPAQDGISNLVKYGLGLNPHEVGTASTDGNSPGMPAILDDGGSSFRFVVVLDGTATDLNVFVEKCTDLSSWERVTSGITETQIADEMVRWEVSSSGEETCFFRLAVEEK
jgi:hypothetical protein